jgi:hypothetical protein
VKALDCTRQVAGATLLLLGFGCGWSSPENYYDKSARLTCRYVKKCETSQWNAAGYDNIGDCVDETTSEADKDEYVAQCDDFDKRAARQCIAAGRKAIRRCDLDAPSAAQKEACATVCGGQSGDIDLVERYHAGEMLDPFHEILFSTLPEDVWNPEAVEAAAD